MTAAALSRPGASLGARFAPAMQIGLPAATLVAMLAVIFWIRPSAMSYFGFTLLFKFAVPLMFAALAQMLIIMLGDIDLSVGSLIALSAVVAARLIRDMAGGESAGTLGMVLASVAVLLLLALPALHETN